MYDESVVSRFKRLVQKLLHRPLAASFALAFAVWLIFFVIVTIWLSVKADETVQRRISLSPTITIDIVRPKDDAAANAAGADALGAVPSSWKNEAGEPAQAMPPPAAAESIPAIEQDQPPVPGAPDPATDEKPAQDNTAAAPAAKAAWQNLAKPFNHDSTQPRIGLIIVNLGLSNTLARTAIATLPADVTLAFQAIAPNVTDWISQSRAAGHESIVMVPMEPYRYPQNDPGPQTLLTSLKDKDNNLRLDWALSRGTNAIGVMPSQGARFMINERVLAPVIDSIKKRGLIFIDTLPADKSAAPALALLARLPFLQNSMTIDAASSRQAIDQTLHDLEVKAKQDGQAIALVIPYPATFERLKSWIATLPEKNLLLAPVSDLMMQKNKAAAQAAAPSPAQPPVVTPATGSSSSTETTTTPAPPAAATAKAPAQSGSSPLLNIDTARPTIIDRSLTVGPAPAVEPRR